MAEDKIYQNFTFSKEEKLCSQKAIDRLFREGASFIAYPLRVVYLVKEKSEEQKYPQVLVSVSKRKFKRANKRNRVKRLVREAYRLQKSSLIKCCEEKEITLHIAFLYLKDELPTYAEIEKAVGKALSSIKEKTGEREL